MITKKSPLKSKTIVSALVGLLFAIFPSLPREVGIDQAELVSSIITILSFLGAIYGRYVANTDIGGLFD